jgi:hypothetical protein
MKGGLRPAYRAPRSVGTGLSCKPVNWGSALAAVRWPRRGHAWLVAAAVVIALLALAVLLVAFPDRHGVPGAATRASRTAVRPRGQPVLPHHASQTLVATVAPSATSRSVPRSFLGLSTEYWSLPSYTRDMPVFGRVLSLLQVPRDGPLLLRVGGNSADHTFWETTVRRLPHWMFQLTPAWLEAARALVHRVSVRLILDLNLVTDRPLVAAVWARAAESQLPRRSIAGFEIGNEPDIYSRWFWLARMPPRRLDPGVLPRDLTAHDYVRDFHAYARLLRQIAPGATLLGPEVANTVRHRSWISTVVSRTRRDLGIVTAHRYPYSACVAPTSRSYPTIARLLNAQASAAMARSVAPAARIAHSAGLPFRLTELNSVTCGGIPGVSNTFANALWAPEALFQLLAAGVDGVNVHVRTDAINAAFRLTRGGLVARPLLYGLVMFQRMLGPGSRLESVRLSADRAPHLQAWAVRLANGRLHVLVIDSGNRPAPVDLRVAAQGQATVQRLLAPSPAATSRVTLGGQWLGPDGRWTGQRATQTVTPGADGYRFTVGRFSAALVTVPTARPAAAGPVA